MAKPTVNFDELQSEAEKLVELLKNRQPGMLGWNQFLMDRIRNIHKLIDPVVWHEMVSLNKQLKKRA